MGWLPSEGCDVAPTFAVYDTATRSCSGFRATPDGGVEPHQV
jgi:hypothetical protein